MSAKFQPEVGPFGPAADLQAQPPELTVALAPQAQQPESRVVSRSKATSKIKLAIGAFCVCAAATFGFIATGVDATTAVGISLSCTLAAERLVGIASSRRSSEEGGRNGTDEETEES